MDFNLLRKEIQTVVNSPNTGNSTNHRPIRPRTLAWHSGDYEELFIFITPCKFGAVWIVKEQGEVKHRDVVLSSPNTHAAFDLAVKAARHWVRTNAPDAKLRFRSTLERGALFANHRIMEGARRLAA